MILCIFHFLNLQYSTCKYQALTFVCDYMLLTHVFELMMVQPVCANSSLLTVLIWGLSGLWCKFLIRVQIFLISLQSLNVRRSIQNLGRFLWSTLHSVPNNVTVSQFVHLLSENDGFCLPCERLAWILHNFLFPAGHSGSSCSITFTDGEVELQINLFLPC